MRTICILVIAVLCTACALPAFAADIVTVPTANQLKAGDFDIAAYHMALDKGPPDWMRAQTLYYGVTDDVEIDLHAYQVDKPIDKESVIVNVTYRLLPETPATPIVVIGGRNLGKATVGLEAATGLPAKNRSWFISAAKTINPPVAGPPKWPIIRLHLSVGTADNTIGGHDRHKGVFGGVQLRLSPPVGMIVLHDSRDLVTGLTYDPIKELTIKGGTYGTNWWVGVSYAKSLK